MAAELRKPVYWTVSVHSIDYDLVLGHMTAVRWDVKEIMSLHNSYVDVLLKVYILCNVNFCVLNYRFGVSNVCLPFVNKL